MEGRQQSQIGFTLLKAELYFLFRNRQDLTSVVFTKSVLILKSNVFTSQAYLNNNRRVKLLTKPGNLNSSKFKSTNRQCFRIKEKMLNILVNK